MAMVFCLGSAGRPYETPLVSPGCRAYQAVPLTVIAERRKGSLLASTTLLAPSICCGAALLQDTARDNATLTRPGIFSPVGLFIGIVSITRKNSERALAVVGAVLSAISLMCIVGLFFN